MKTDFNILWIDDERASYDSVADDIDFHLSGLGFRSRTEFSTDAEGIVQKVRAANPFFIVLDYNLGGVTGDTFIQQLRDANCFHEVLFYTQDGFSAEQMSLFFRNPTTGMALGVSFCDKSERKQRVTELISLKATQVADLATQRGWIVADAIELEWRVSELLVATSEKLHKCFGQTFERLLENDKVDFGWRCSLLNGLLKDWINNIRELDNTSPKIATLNAIKAVLSQFSAEVIEVRNTIAHQRSIVAPDGTVQLPARQRRLPDIVFDAAYIASVRRGLVKHEDNLVRLKSLLEAPDAT